MRKTILSMLFLALAILPAMACGYDPAWESVAPFRIVTPLDGEKSQYGAKGLDETSDFWFNYMGGRIKKEAIRHFFESCSYKEVQNGEWNSDPFYAAVQRQGGFASQYLEACLLLQSANEYSWEYETNTEDIYNQVVKMLNKMTTPPEAFRDRVTFLRMRTLFARAEYDKCMELWNKYKDSIKDEKMRQRIYGYVAGVYYYRGEYPRALEVFQELGDDMSVVWCLQQMVGYKHILEQSQQNPNGIVLQYLIQDYANYYYNTVAYQDRLYDCDPDPEAIAAARNEGAKMKTLARQMAAQKGSNAMMWMTTLAWMEWAEGSYTQALADAREAEKLKGNAAMRECNDRLLLLCTIAAAPTVPDEKVLKDLATRVLALYEKGKQEIKGEASNEWSYEENGFNYSFYMGEVHPRLINYLESLDLQQSILLTEKLTAQMDVYETRYGSAFFSRINHSASLDDVLTLQEMMRTGKGDNAYTKALLKQVNKDDQLLLDVIGTKYMRLGQYGKAYEALSQLKEKYLLSTNVNPYLTQRVIRDENPFERTQYDEPNFQRTSALNVKADFCRQVADLLQTIRTSEGDFKARAEYRLANMFFQASRDGDLWAIGDFEWTSWRGEDPDRDEFQKQASVQLHNAAKDASDEELLLRIHYGQAYLSTLDMAQFSQSYDWSAKRYVYNFTLSADGRQAFDYLVAHRSPIDYVQTCDNINQYRRQNIGFDSSNGQAKGSGNRKKGK